MTPQDYLDHVAAESAHFASSSAGSLDAPIDFLGEWTVRDLVAHLGGVYSGVIARVAPAGSDPETAAQPSPPPGVAINDWFAERRTTLLTSFSAARDDAPAETFAGPKTVAWWKRRLAHETAVHRWDAAAAVDGIDVALAIDSDLAKDGIDEFLEVSLRSSSSRPDRVYPAESLHLHRTDGPGEWTVVGDGQGGVTVTHEHGKGDAAVRGSASSLLLWMWGRPVSDVEIFGDEAVAAAWRSLAP